MYFMSIQRPVCGIFPRDEELFDMEHDPSWVARDCVERDILLAMIDGEWMPHSFTAFVRSWRADHTSKVEALRAVHRSQWPDWVSAYEDCDVLFGGRLPDETPEQAAQDAVDSIGEEEGEEWICKPIFMRPVRGAEAYEAFDAEFASGWMPCSEDAIDAVPFWEATRQ